MSVAASLAWTWDAGRWRATIDLGPLPRQRAPLARQHRRAVAHGAQLGGCAVAHERAQHAAPPWDGVTDAYALGHGYARDAAPQLLCASRAMLTGAPWYPLQWTHVSAMPDAQRCPYGAR